VCRVGHRAPAAHPPRAAHYVCARAPACARLGARVAGWQRASCHPRPRPRAIAERRVRTERIRARPRPALCDRPPMLRPPSPAQRAAPHCCVPPRPFLGWIILETARPAGQSSARRENAWTRVLRAAPRSLLVRAVQVSAPPAPAVFVVGLPGLVVRCGPKCMPHVRACARVENVWLGSAWAMHMHARARGRTDAHAGACMHPRMRACARTHAPARRSAEGKAD